jgi:hypothetical protein
MGREGEWDNGKLLMMNAVEAASEAALAREDLVGCFAEVIDRVLPYLRSHALFEGPRGDYSGWTPYTTVQNAFEEVSKRVGPDRADWVAEWEAFWDDPAYPKP